jgi:hypothetical protein
MSLFSRCLTLLPHTHLTLHVQQAGGKGQCTASLTLCHKVSAQVTLLQLLSLFLSYITHLTLHFQQAGGEGQCAAPLPGTSLSRQLLHT